MLLFGLLALVLLAAGGLGAQALWYAVHHRYDQPNSGYYYGSVHAHFDSSGDDVYLFSFQGKTDPRWRWVYSTNLIYQSLQFEWSSFGRQTSTGSGTVRLPSFAYESSHGTGILTRAVLSSWLLETTNRAPESIRSIDAIFGFIEDAGRGTLPAPKHHPHRLEQPVRAQIQHFSLGFGVGGFVYIWMGVWLSLVVVIARKLWSRHGET